MLADIRNFTRTHFMSNFSEDFLSDPDNGGEKCYNYLSFDFKLTVTIFAV